MGEYKKWFDVGALGVAAAGILMLVFIGLTLGYIYGRSGDWFDAVFFGGLPLAGVFLIGFFLRKIKFFA